METEKLWQAFADETTEEISSPNVDEEFITYVENGCGSKGETGGTVDEGPSADGSIVNILFRLWEQQR